MRKPERIRPQRNQLALHRLALAIRHSHTRKLKLLDLNPRLTFSL
jgi:hypothetical protein